MIHDWLSIIRCCLGQPTEYRIEQLCDNWRMSFIKQSLRWLLRLDVPFETLNSAEAETYRDRHFRWNYLFNSLDVICFMGSISLLSATTILPLFISKLTDNTIPLALTAILAQAGFFLPQLFTSNFIERLDRKKPVVTNLGFLTERLPAILLVGAGAAAYWSSTLALILFLFFFAWFNLGGGIIATAWQDLIARCFPVNWRGRFFGGNMFLGTAIGVGAASLAGVVLEQFAFPLNFIIIFGMAAIGINLSWGALLLVREPVEKSIVPRRSTTEYLRELPNVLRNDLNFRNFLIARFVLAIAEMGSGFLTVAAIQQWAIADSMVASFTTASLVGQTIASLIMGVLADRYGHRLSLEVSAVAATLAFGAAWFAPDPSWYLPVFFLLGYFTGARIVSGTLVVMEFCVPEKRPTYIGLASTITGIGSAIAPLIGVGLVEIGFDWAFAASTLTSLTALLMLRYWVREPRFEEINV